MTTLTEVEQKLVEYVTRGDMLDLAGTEVITEEVMHSWEESRTVRAWVIRDIMRGCLAPDPDPHGLQLRGARIEGRLDLESITSAVALKLADCLLDEGMIASDAHLSLLSLQRCRLRHPVEPAVNAIRLVATVLDLGQSVLTGHGEYGALAVISAHFGVLNCSGAILHNDSGPALNADDLRVEQALFLRYRFYAFGTDGSAAVRLVGAHVGELDCDDANLHNVFGSALNADRLQVDRNMFLSGSFTAMGEGVAVDLRSVRVGGSLMFNPRLAHSTNPQQRLIVDGLVYAGLPKRISSNEWLRLLREGTPSYAAQPYQQLAAAHRVAGHDGEVRRILMAQRRDQIYRRVLTGRAERGWARLTGLVLGYGYQPWRALLCLLSVLFVAVVLAVVLGGHGGLAAPQSGVGCTVAQRVGVGLDLGTPLLKTNVSAQCQTTNATPGQVLMVAGWVLQLLAWAFATLFIAGFTGVVRKT